MQNSLSFETLDPNFAAPELDGDWAWHAVAAESVRGRGWPGETPGFGRLPARAEGIVRPEIWEIGRCSAGLSIDFTTDSPRLAANWGVGSEKMALDHMPASGKSGLDLYVRHKLDGWRWAATGRAMTPIENTRELFKNAKRVCRRFRLHLPLYNSLETLRLGIKPGAQLKIHAPGPIGIVLYGTSIVQGGCASRPGMGYSAVLQRRLGRSIANLGFSGNARCEPEMASLLGELKPELFVLDPLANVPIATCGELVGNFLEILLAARPGISVAMVDDLNAPKLELMAERDHGWNRKRAAMAGLKKHFSGRSNLYWLSGANLLGTDGEATVDGTHPTDLGFMRIADALAPNLAIMLAKARNAASQDQPAYPTSRQS